MRAAGTAVGTRGVERWQLCRRQQCGKVAMGNVVCPGCAVPDGFPGVRPRKLAAPVVAVGGSG